MRANIHTPERLKGEATSAYHLRRTLSRDAVHAMTFGKRAPKFVPQTRSDGTPVVPDMGYYWTGQHTTTPARRVRRASIKLIGIRQYKRMAAQMVVPA